MVFSVTSFPGLPWLQFLIACSMQTVSNQKLEPGNEVSSVHMTSTTSPTLVPLTCTKPCIYKMLHLKVFDMLIYCWLIWVQQVQNIGKLILWRVDLMRVDLMRVDLVASVSWKLILCKEAKSYNLYSHTFSQTQTQLKEGLSWFHGTSHTSEVKTDNSVVTSSLNKQQSYVDVPWTAWG